MKFALAAALALLAATPALADDRATLQVLREAWLLGRWAPDCSLPAAIENSWVFIGEDARTKTIVDVETFGSEAAPSSYQVISARRLDARSVEMREVWEGDEETYVSIVRIENGRMRTWEVRNAQGELQVKDGVIVVNGHANDWRTRCGD